MGEVDGSGVLSPWPGCQLVRVGLVQAPGLSALQFPTSGRWGAASLSAHRSLSGLFLGMAQIFSGGRILSLASAHLSDSGTYSCVATSAVGEDRWDAVLQVQGKYSSLTPLA